MGKVALVENLNEPATINPQLVVFKDIKMNVKYFYYAMVSDILKYQISLSINGGVVPTLTQENIQNYIIPKPPLTEQKQIANYLDNKIANLNKTKAKIEKQINLLEEYKESLIYNVVTGKFDVRGEDIWAQILLKKVFKRIL